MSSKIDKVFVPSSGECYIMLNVLLSAQRRSKFVLSHFFPSRLWCHVPLMRLLRFPSPASCGDFRRTTSPNIYACGDCASPYKFTHAADWQVSEIRVDKVGICTWVSLPLRRC